MEASLPGRQGRLIFAYLVAHRHSLSTRAALMHALWEDQAPRAADTALNALLAKVRAVVGSDALEGRHEVRLVLPMHTWVDIEAATEGLHRAESAVSLNDWIGAWGPARVALHIAVRSFLPGQAGAWLETMREKLWDILVRAHECVAASGLGIGGPELASALRSARAAIALSPYRESSYRLLMQALARQGNVAEALVTYENLRRRLREELGAGPAPATQALHMQLLRGEGK